ncbi:MAG: hypothetical protein V9E96_00335 [Chitinophagaceae bacterium]
MASIKVFDKSFVPYINAATIAEKIEELAQHLKADYDGKRPLFIAILNGSFMFASDLFKAHQFRSRNMFYKIGIV